VRRAQQADREHNRARLRDVVAIVQGHRRWVAGAVTLALIASALGLVQPLVVKHVIDAAAREQVVWTAIVLLFVLFTAEALVLAAHYVLGRTGEGIVLGVRVSLISQLLRLDMRAYERHRLGDLISRVSTDSTALRRLVAEGFSEAVTALIGIVGTVALMIWLDRLLFLIVTAFVLVGVLILVGVLRGIGPASLRSQRSIGEMTADLERALKCHPHRTRQPRRTARIQQDRSTGTLGVYRQRAHGQARRARGTGQSTGGQRIVSCDPAHRRLPRRRRIKLAR
jgi:ABC-type multidrug transport system fused ATPase/permease subunit